jgi:ATP-dependent Clp protease ATP-binding subunit ClpA
LGLLRSDPRLQSTLGPGGIEDVVGQIESPEAASRRVPPMESLPLSQECRLAASQAAEDAASMGEPRVTTAHLVNAILQQETTLAARILRDRGFRL